MFRTRWRSERNRIKAVFRLHFRATQVPHPGWEGLVVSLVPVDGGKATAKSDKAVVVDGVCCWEKAIFETVRFSREPRSGKINERTYRFLVSATESPKARLLGEATFDFASYAQVPKPSSVTLHLKASDSNPILHVIVQRMQDGGEERVSEENEVSQQRGTLQIQISNCDERPDKEYNSSTDFKLVEDAAPFNSAMQSKIPSSSHSPHIEYNGSLAKSTSFDALYASESEVSTEQCTPKVTGLKLDNTNRDSRSFLSSPANDGCRKTATTSYDSVTEGGAHWRSTTECSISSAPDASSDGSTNSSEDNGLRERLKGSDMSLEKLENEIVSLARQLEVSELELHALRKQVVKEKRQGEDLSKELCIVRDERDTLKRKCELLKASEFNVGIERVNGFQVSGEDLKPLLEEMKQELNHEKNLNANLHLQLQKMQESNMELVLAVKDLEELLVQRSRDMPCTCSDHLPVKPPANDDSLQMKNENEFSSLHQREPCKKLSDTISEHEDEQLEVIAKKQDDGEAECSLEQKIADLTAQVKLYNKDHDDMEMQMEQLALEFEIVKQENHDLSSRLEQSQLREQLKIQYESSAHTSIINDLEAHVEYLEKELEKQLETFEADLSCIIKTKIEQEQRAIQAEEELRKTNLNNANTAKQLQKEIKRLSIQMSTAFDSNENLAKQAFTEASELRLQNSNLEVSLEKANEELASIKCQHKTQLCELLRQIDLKIEDVNQLTLKLKNTNDVLEIQKISDYAKQKALLEEISELKAAATELSQENCTLSQQLKQESNLLTKMEQERSQEKAAHDSEVASIREEVKQSIEEQISLRHLKDEKEKLITTLRSDIEALKIQYNWLKNEKLMKQKALAENEIERERLMKDVLQLKGTLQKKSDGSKKSAPGNKNVSATALCGTKDIANLREKIKNLEDKLKMKDTTIEALKHTYSKKLLGSRREGLHNGLIELEQNGSQLVSEDAVYLDNMPKTIGMSPENHGTEHFPSSEINDLTSACNRNGADNITFSNASSPRMKLYSRGCNNHQSNSAEESSREVAALKEKNEAMKIELKEMQGRYSEISLKFAEVEGERQQLVMTIRSLKNAMKI